MEYTKLGNSDLTVSRICMGCMGFGDPHTGQHSWTIDEEHSREVLQQALASLGDVERQVVLLHAVTGLKHREIAALLEMPLATVLSKYHRALKKLRVQLEGDDAL